MGGLSIVFGLILGFIVLFVGAEINKEYLCTDKYTMDSPCFDLQYRCEVECSMYGLNFTGELPKGHCSCQCDENNSVSFCSGFLYTKTPEKFRNGYYEDITNRTLTLF